MIAGVANLWPTAIPVGALVLMVVVGWRVHRAEQRDRVDDRTSHRVTRFELGGVDLTSHVRSVAFRTCTDPAPFGEPEYARGGVIRPRVWLGERDVPEFVVPAGTHGNAPAGTTVTLDPVPGEPLVAVTGTRVRYTVAPVHLADGDELADGSVVLGRGVPSTNGGRIFLVADVRSLTGERTSRTFDRPYHPHLHVWRVER